MAVTEMSSPSQDVKGGAEISAPRSSNRRRIHGYPALLRLAGFSSWIGRVSRWYYFW